MIGTVSSVLADHHFNHTKLNTLFMEAGAPGQAPDGNCEKKCAEWLIRCNQDSSVDELQVLGCVLQEYMDHALPKAAPLFGTQPNSAHSDGQSRVHAALAKCQLSYSKNGFITAAGSNPIIKSLNDHLKAGDYSSIEKEFERAVENIGSDPHASITAACSIIEATLKFYIEIYDLVLPSKLNVIPLWQVVKSHLGLNKDPQLAGDQSKVLTGLSSIIDAVGAFRSHIGSAHGRGSSPPGIVVAEARLFVNSAHTIVIFLMDAVSAKPPT